MGVVVGGAPPFTELGAEEGKRAAKGEEREEREEVTSI